MREIDRLAGMVEELLVLSRAGERELPGEQVDLGDAAERGVERWRGAAETPASTSGPWRWRAAARGARSRTSTARSTRSWRTPCATRPPGRRAHRVRPPSAIEVVDEGPGLEQGEEEQVFERFHRGRAGAAARGHRAGAPDRPRAGGGWGGTVVLQAAHRRRWTRRRALRARRHPGAPPPPRPKPNRAMTVRTMITWIVAAVLGLALAAGVRAGGQSALQPARGPAGRAAVGR